MPIGSPMDRVESWWSVSSPPLGKLVSECISAKERANRRPGYVRELKRALGKFVAGRETADPQGISPAEIETFFDASGYSNATRLTMIMRLGALFSWAQRRGYLAHNPVKRLERPAVDRKPPRILSPMEAFIMLTGAQKREASILGYIVVGLYAGVRPHEMGRLTWADIDLEKRVVRIDAAASKVRFRRVVPLHEKAVHWLKACDQSKPFAPGTRRKKLRRLAAFMHWERWPHDLLRHTAASYLLALHRDPGKVSFMLGNSPQVLLQHYQELVSTEDCAAFWALDGLKSPA